jgi:hypothetical protein
MSAVVILLDDVTPHYVKAGAALKACDVDLGIALYSLIDSEAAPHGSRYPDAAAAAAPHSGDSGRFHAGCLRLALLQCTAKRIRRSSVHFPWVPRPNASCPACALQELDIHFHAVDANRFASAVGRAGRG